MAEHFDVPAPTARQRWIALTALVGSIGLAGFVLVACSGSSKSATSPTASSAAAAGASTSAAATAASSAATGSSTAGSSTASSSASSSLAAPHGSSSSSFCAFARQVTKQQSKNVAVFTSGNPAAIERLEKQELSILNVAVASAPSSIRPSMVIIANVDKSLFKQLQAVKFDFRKLTPAQTQGLDSPALTKASDKVSSYITNVCHISTASPTR